MMLTLVIAISSLLGSGQEGKAGSDKGEAAHKAVLTEACSPQATGRIQQCTSELIWFIRHSPADSELAGAGVYLALAGNKQQKQQVNDAWAEAVRSQPENADVKRNAQLFDGMSQTMGNPETRTAPTDLTQRKTSPTPAPTASTGIKTQPGSCGPGEKIDSALDPHVYDEGLALSGGITLSRVEGLFGAGWLDCLKAGDSVQSAS